MNSVDPVQEFRKCANCPQYEVARNGFVRHSVSKKPTTQQINNCGYCYITIYSKVAKRNKNYKIHRLVAEAYLENPEQKREVDHRNGCRTDNCLENLRWATRSENCSNKPRKLIGGYRGVYHLGQDRYRAGISNNNKMVWFGVFKTAEEGAKAYNDWVKNNNQQEWRQLNVLPTN
jgi:hypothetical protein